MPLSEDVLRACLERIGEDAPVRFDEVTRSTQATAEELAAAGAPEWTLVAAAHQTRGRGRLGRSWLDAPGALLFSMVLRPGIEAAAAGLLTLLAGASMARALRRTTGADVVCKWPNDLRVGEAKVGGILAGSVVRDGAVEHVVLGVGVNLGAAPEVPGAGAASAADPADVLGRFLEDFARDYRSADLRSVVATRYRPLCATLGRRVRASTVEGELVEGVAEDLDELGGLLVRTDAGQRTVRFGEVQHLDSLPGSGAEG